MKVLILGVSGLIGWGIYSVLKHEQNVKLLGTYNSKDEFRSYQDFYHFNIIQDDSIYKFIENENPKIVINALGITKHLQSRYSSSDFVNINSTFPKTLSELCHKLKCNLIHISTDCVFDGTKGNYGEEDKPNATDVYGFSKAQAEIIKDKSLVLRTSTVGFEKKTKFGLLEWFLNQAHSCEGYKNAFFSGITSYELGLLIKNYFLHQKVKGIYNIGSKRISKYDLLNVFAKHYKKNVKIFENTTYSIDRSLNCNKFIDKFNYSQKSWELMLSELP